MLLRQLLAVAALALPLTAGDVVEGTAKSAMTGDFMPNSCAYDEFSNQFISAAESRFAYVTTSHKAEEVCGRCAEVRLAPSSSHSTPNSTVTVMLISQYEGDCGGGSANCPNDIKLSAQAYRDMLNGGSGSRFKVQWQLVNCPEDFVTGNLELAFDDATNANIITIQPRNYNGRITDMVAKFDDEVTVSFGAPGENAAGSYRAAILADDKDHSFAEDPFTIALTHESGDIIEVRVDTLPAPNEILITDQQFD